MSIPLVGSVTSMAAPTVAVFVTHYLSRRDRRRIETKVDDVNELVNGNHDRVVAKLDAVTVENTALKVAAATDGERPPA